VKKKKKKTEEQSAADSGSDPAPTACKHTVLQCNKRCDLKHMANKRNFTHQDLPAQRFLLFSFFLPCQLNVLMQFA